LPATPAGPHQKPEPERIEGAEHSDGAGRQNGQKNEGGRAAARQHPVIDFQHVEGRRQCQNAHGSAEDQDDTEQSPIRLERSAHGVGIDGGRAGRRA
jgi:hypothetical protein